MNNILAIDTSSAKCTVAISTDDALLQLSSEADRQSAQHVLPMLGDLLASAELLLSEIDLIAVMAGPGSFTGLRIGVGVAQGLSMANSTPAIAISSLAAKAMAAIRETELSNILVSEKAREGEVYFAAYRESETLGVKLVGDEQVANPGQLKSATDGLKIDNWCAAGNGWADREEIQSQLKYNIPGTVIEPEVQISDLCSLARLRYAAGEAVSAEQLRPNYVKEQLHYG